MNRRRLLGFVGKHVGWVLAPTRRSPFSRVRASTHPTDQGRSPDDDFGGPLDIAVLVEPVLASAAGGNIQIQAEAEYACALGGGGSVEISVSGYAAIEGSLTLYAAAPIKDPDGQPTWGDLALTVLDAHAPAGRSGTFTNDLAVGDYLGYGIWFGDRLGRGVIYTDNTVEVAIFQAAAGPEPGRVSDRQRSGDQRQLLLHARRRARPQLRGWSGVASAQIRPVHRIRLAPVDLVSR